MGPGYGFGGLGKMFGPVALGLFADTSNLVTPKATIAAITPAFALWAATKVDSLSAFVIRQKAFFY
ncbi:MAG: hypothetical protein ABSF48_09520 [Thermodesulfobacteriota bacterium]|jgi:putative MFS transporter